MVASGASVEVEEANEDAVVMVASLPEADPVRSWSVAALIVDADFATRCTVARHSRTTSCLPLALQSNQEHS